MALKSLDTPTLLEFFMDGPAAVQVEELLVRAEKTKQRILISSLSWGDLYLYALKKSVATAERLVRELEVLPIEVVADDERLALARAAAQFQADGKVQSISDAYAAAVAKVRRTELWTTNRAMAALKDDVKVHYIAAQ